MGGRDPCDGRDGPGAQRAQLDEAGISEGAVDAVIAKVTDGGEVARARLFPYQVWAAYKHAPSDNWRRALRSCAGAWPARRCWPAWTRWGGRSARGSTPLSAIPPSPAGTTRSATGGRSSSTDDQQHDSGHVRLDHVPLIYTFNIAGYSPSALPTGEWGRYTIGCFTDATFTAGKVLEDDHKAEWPF